MEQVLGPRDPTGLLLQANHIPVITDTATILKPYCLPTTVPGGLFVLLQIANHVTLLQDRSI